MKESSPRSIRVDDKNLELAAHQFQHHRPSFLHEKDILAVAIKRGLRVMAEATLLGDGQDNGLDPAALASELRQLLLLVVDFLADQHKLLVYPCPCARYAERRSRTSHT